MRQQNRSKSTLFLMELIIVIFFFSICAAICVNVFGSAQQMARDSHNLSNAVMAARSAAGCYKSADGDIGAAVELLDGAMSADHGIVYYDKEWQQVVSADESRFYLLIDPLERSGEAVVAVFESNSSEDALFQLQVKTSRGGGAYAE